MSIQNAIQQVIDRKNLDADTMREAMRTIMSGNDADGSILE